jgi:hypothetical protein
MCGTSSLLDEFFKNTDTFDVSLQGTSTLRNATKSFERGLIIQDDLEWRGLDSCGSGYTSAEAYYCVHGSEPACSIKGEEFSDQMTVCLLHKKDNVSWRWLSSGL